MLHNFGNALNLVMHNCFVCILFVSHSMVSRAGDCKCYNSDSLLVIKATRKDNKFRDKLLFLWNIDVCRARSLSLSMLELVGNVHVALSLYV